MFVDLFLALGLVSKAPPAIIAGDVQGVKNIELVSFTGPLCSLDVDRDGKEEIFFVSEARGWRDEWIDGRWVAYEVLSKRINEMAGDDTIMVASYHLSFSTKEKPPAIFVSMGFLDASGDGLMDVAIAFWDDEGFSQMTVYDLSGLDRNQRPEITCLMPDLKWASYEFAWPVVRVKGPYGKREYLWNNGEWLERD